jgi:hypothetical protein
VRRTGLLALVLVLAGSASARASFDVVTSWGSPGTGAGQFVTPSGVSSDGSGTIYVSDVAAAAGRVQRFDPDGAFVGAFGTPGTGLGQFSGASHVAADALGSVYVTDAVDARVQKFTTDGTFVAAWGSRGSGDGQFQQPAGVATDTGGNVFVVDSQTNRVQRFTSDGAFDVGWGATGTGAGQFSSAQDVAVDVFGDVYVVDSLANRVQKFTSDGALLPGWGGAGAGEGQFNRPTGIGTDGSGNVFVADTANQRVQVFTSEGAYVTRFGSAGSGPGQFTNPVDVASDATGAVYVVDQGNSRVQKFAEPIAPLPPPVVGKTANIEVVSGAVLVRPPGAARFAPLKGEQQIPVGTTVQARAGRAKLTTARDLRGRQQSARFYAGLFVLRQRRAQVPVTELELAGSSFAGCAKSVARARVVRPSGGLQARSAAKRPKRPKRSKRVVRRLWGDGKGTFRTRGRHSSAAVRGTKWLTADRCDGTLVRVVRGRVEVRDFVRKRTVVVKAGHSYLARRP